MRVFSFVCCVTLLILVVVCAFFVGEIEVSLKELWLQESLEAQIVFDHRVLRVFASVIIGGALALSGALYQGVIGNPLVSPSILGVLNGAAFGAAFGLMLGLSPFWIQIICFCFGVLAMLLALALSQIFSRENAILMLILGGIISASIFSALLSMTKILADPYNTLPSIVYWLMGSLAHLEKFALIFAALVFVCVAICSFLLAKVLDILNLDEESAQSLGVNVKPMRYLFIVFATLLASSSVAMAGIIGWVGLVIPHIARLLVGATHRIMLPFCVCFGGIFLCVCDTLSRSLANVEIPLGIVTGIFGIPLFIAVLLINKRING